MNCCGKFHKGVMPSNALELMRSRYSAYALNLVDYIIDTTHPDGPHYQNDRAAWKKSLQKYCKATLFDKLTILEFIDGEQEAFVTFRADLRHHNQSIPFTEKSHFLKVNDRWLYFSTVS